MGLYQFGLLHSVREPPLPGLGVDAVDASGEAYVLGHTPDSALGIVNGGVTLVLAGRGGPKRAKEHPLIPLALIAKILLGAVNGGYSRLSSSPSTRRSAVTAPSAPSP